MMRLFYVTILALAHAGKNGKFQIIFMLKNHMKIKNNFKRISVAEVKRKGESRNN